MISGGTHVRISGNFGFIPGRIPDGAPTEIFVEIPSGTPRKIPEHWVEHLEDFPVEFLEKSP